MRKLCFVLTALLLTAPSFAGVVLSCTQTAPDSNVVQVSYVASDDANRPRAFGLDITLDNGMLIGDIVSGSESSDYWVYPGTIVITSGSITDLGTPMAPGIDPGALGGPDTSGMTIEMGSLYNDPCDPEHDTPPALAGVLFQFTVYGVNDCNVAISGNSARGNVVLEDTEQAQDVTYGTCKVENLVPTECYAGQPDYSEWVAAGSPTCWCYPRQCHGDADGLSQGSAIAGYAYVSTNDLGVLIAGWQVKDPPKGSGILDISVNGVPAACADFDHIRQGSAIAGYARVSTNDLGRLIEYWQVKEPAKGSGTPADCLPGTETP